MQCEKLAQGKKQLLSEVDPWARGMKQDGGEPAILEQARGECKYGYKYIKIKVHNENKYKCRAIKNSHVFYHKMENISVFEIDEWDKSFKFWPHISTN